MTERKLSVWQADFRPQHQERQVERAGGANQALPQGRSVKMSPASLPHESFVKSSIKSI